MKTKFATPMRDKNVRRGKRVEKAFEAYCVKAMGYSKENIKIEAESPFVDLITDLLHLAMSQGHDTDAILRMAENNFVAEVKNIDDDDDDD